MTPQDEATGLALRLMRAAAERRILDFVTPASATAEEHEERWREHDTGICWVYLDPGDWYVDLLDRLTGYAVVDLIFRDRALSPSINMLANTEIVVVARNVLTDAVRARGRGVTIGIAATKALLDLWGA